MGFFFLSVDSYMYDFDVVCVSGDMLYLHSFRNPGLIIDIVQDISKLNRIAVFARCTGMIILGGGVVKHHICNANLMRNGADFAVYINTAQEVL
jgi:deoxyhypusine synthase